jgi:Transposase
MQHMNEVVERTRRQERRELKGAGDDRLTGTKYVWSDGEENVPNKRRDRLARRLTARGMMRKPKTT